MENDIVDITPENRTDMHTALHQLLRRFNLDWGLMRAVMLATGAVISGSAALAVLQIGEFVPQDLDIYVTSKNLAVVLVFLQEQGYKVQIPMSTADNTQNYTETSVMLTLQNDTGEKIDLIATLEGHVIHAITRFHSTCVMNFIAYYGIVCLYPQWTMRKAALVRAGVSDYQAIYKYRGRGFNMLHRSAELPDYEPSHMCGKHQCCPKAKRELHDHITFVVVYLPRR